MDSSLKKTILEQAQGAAALNVAFVGVARGLFDALDEGPLSADLLSRRAGIDPGYGAAFCEAAFAFGYLDVEADGFALTATGRAFTRREPESLFALPVGAVLGAHMAERAAFHSATGARPGESVLAERETILPLFGPMLEQSFAPFFAGEITERVPVFAELDRRHGTAVDLGCGNGWYLRALARRFPGLRGVGLDGFEENIAQARRLAEAAGLGQRLDFRAGDLRHAVALGASGPNQAKAYVRCGMGPCQGFPCWELMSAVVAASGVTAVDRPSHRPPRRAMTVAQAAGLADLVEPLR